MRNYRLLLPGLLLVGALAAVFAWSVHDKFERVTVERDVGYRGEARTDPFLALQRLYSALGVPARTLPAGLRELPPSDHALILASPRRSFSEERLHRLFDWVEKGGRLVVVLGEAPTLDPLLARFGVRTQGDPGKETGHRTVEVPLRGGGTAKVEVANAPRLLDGSGTARLAVGEFLLRFDHGAGQVTFLSDAGFLTNEHIGEAANARVAWGLLQRPSTTREAPRGAWLVVRDELPTLSGLLLRHAWAAVLSILALLAAWLWASGARFGPAVPDPPRDRRRLLEHIEAAGDFLLRTGRGGDLAQAARGALLRRVELREPEWARLPPPQLAERLAAVSGRAGGASGVGGMSLPAARIESALTAPVDSPAELAVTVQILENLRRSL